MAHQNNREEPVWGSHCMTVQTSVISSWPVNRRAFFNSGRCLTAAVVSAAVLLSGCAHLRPLAEQLREDKVTRITLVVEEGPFHYTVPSAMDPATGGSPLVALIGALAAIAVQNSLETVNAKLATAASEKSINVDHRKVFVEGVVRKLGAQGMTVDVIPARFESSVLGKERLTYRPVLAGVSLPENVPAFRLNLDVGACTIGSVIACVRYLVAEIPPGSKNPPTAADPFRIPSASNSTLAPVRYGSAQGTLPGVYKAQAPQFKVFPSVDDAIANVKDFDEQLSRIVPMAVDELVNWFFPPTLSTGTTPARL